jgi:hypothetical protein
VGVKLSPGGEILCLPLHSSKQWRVFTPGGEQRGEVIPWGRSYPLGVKFSVRPSILLNSRECSPLDGGERRGEL